MKKQLRCWQPPPIKKAIIQPSISEKESTTEFFKPLIEEFKKECILENPNKNDNYLVDIYTKWHQNFFYICEKYKAEYPNRILDEYEDYSSRLRYTGTNQFEFSYFRYNQTWHSVAEGLTLEQCKELILSNSLFRPTVWR